MNIPGLNNTGANSGSQADTAAVQLAQGAVTRQGGMVKQPTILGFLSRGKGAFAAVHHDPGGGDESVNLGIFDQVAVDDIAKRGDMARQQTGRR
jgi:hypothetical protein